METGAETPHHDAAANERPFIDPRRLLAELMGTFALTFVAAGGPVMAAAGHVSPSLPGCAPRNRHRQHADRCGPSRSNGASRGCLSLIATIEAEVDGQETISLELRNDIVNTDSASDLSLLHALLDHADGVDQ